MFESAAFLLATGGQAVETVGNDGKRACFSRAAWLLHEFRKCSLIIYISNSIAFPQNTFSLPLFSSVFICLYDSRDKTVCDFCTGKKLVKNGRFTIVLLSNRN